MILGLLTSPPKPLAALFYSLHSESISFLTHAGRFTRGRRFPEREILTYHCKRDTHAAVRSNQVLADTMRREFALPLQDETKKNMIE